MESSRPCASSCAVVAPPQPVVARAEEQRRGPLRIYRKPLAHAAPVFVAPHLEWYGNNVPGGAAIAAAKDCGRRPRVHAGGDVDHVRVLGVWSDAFERAVAV